MEDDSKTYMWLVIITFIGFAIATGFALMELTELQAPVIVSPSPFN